MVQCMYNIISRIHQFASHQRTISLASGLYLTFPPLCETVQSDGHLKFADFSTDKRIDESMTISVCYRSWRVQDTLMI